MRGVNYALVCPLPNSSIEECEKWRHSKLPSQTFASRHINFASCENKEEKKNFPGLVTRCETNSRHLNVVKRTCKGTKFCMTILASRK